MTSLTIAENGQLTLGQEELHHLGLQPGDTIELAPLPSGELLLKPTAARKNTNGFIGQNAGKAKTQSGIERFIHSLDGKVNLEKPLTIEDINNLIAAGWAGELKPE